MKNYVVEFVFVGPDSWGEDGYDNVERIVERHLKHANFDFWVGDGLRIEEHEDL